MEQNSQNGAFYPPAFSLHHHTFNSALERSSEDPSHFLSPGYAPPSAPSSATQGFHTTDSLQGMDYGMPQQERETCNVMTAAASNSTANTSGDNFFQALDSVNKRLLQLENKVEGLECSIEGLKRTENEKHMESSDKLARLELLVKEVLSGVQHLNESQKLDEAMSQMRKLQVVDEKASVAEEVQKPLMERQRHPNESHSYLEPSNMSEHLMQHVPVPPLPLQYSEVPLPPQSQNYAASHNILPTPPSMNEPSKPTILHPYPSSLPLPQAPPLPPPSSVPLPPHHSMKIPLFSYQPQPRESLPIPPPQGLSNPSLEGTPYGHAQMHQQYTEPHRPLSSSYSEIPQYYGGGARQEVLHGPPQYGPIGTQVYEPASGMVGPPLAFGPPYTQSRSPSSPPASMYEMTNGTGYNNGPPYRAAQPVPSTPSGGGSHSRLSKVQPALPASNEMPVGSAPTNRHQIHEVTEKVITMGFSREQVRAVVQGLTESGQPVDMNGVLDKLMNRGESPQPQRGWYNRG